MSEQHTREFRVTLTGAAPKLGAGDIERILEDSMYRLGRVTAQELPAPVADAPAGDAGLVAWLQYQRDEWKRQHDESRTDFSEGAFRAYFTAAAEAERRAEGSGVTVETLIRDLPGHTMTKKPNGDFVATWTGQALGMAKPLTLTGESRTSAVNALRRLLDKLIEAGVIAAAAAATERAGGAG